MAYDNIRGLFAIPGVFFNTDIGGWGYSDRTPNKDATMDARYIHIARNRIRRMIKLQSTHESLQSYASAFMGGVVSILNTPHGSIAYVVTPCGILWLDRPPVYVIDPDHSNSAYRLIIDSTNDFYKTARRFFLR